jgi:hypothetical protein
MKTNVKSMLLVSVLATVTILSCKKENSVIPEAPISEQATLSTLFAEKAAPKQTFTIDANQYQKITGAKGTILKIQPGSFKTMSGQTVTGNVTIELREIYSKSDMIFSKAPTMSNNQILISGGELFLEAYQNGGELTLASTNSIAVMVPTTNPGPMREFYNDLPFSRESQGMELPLNWELTDSTYTDSIDVIEDSVNNFENPYYYFYLDGMNWINCDYFWGNPGPFTDVNVNVGSEFNGSNCTIYISFDGQNSVVSLFDYDLNNVFDYGYDSFPQGSNVHIIAVGSVNGQYYSSIVPATLGANFSTTLTLTQTTLSQLTADINALP